MERFDYKLEKVSGFPVIKPQGYLNEQAGIKLKEIIDDLFKQGDLFMVMDLCDCDLINSLGVAAILDASLRVNEDFQGGFVLSSLKPLMVEILDLACVTDTTEVFENTQTAIARLTERKS